MSGREDYIQIHTWAENWQKSEPCVTWDDNPSYWQHNEYLKVIMDFKDQKVEVSMFDHEQTCRPVCQIKKEHCKLNPADLPG